MSQIIIRLIIQTGKIFTVKRDAATNYAGPTVVNQDSEPIQDNFTLPESNLRYSLGMFYTSLKGVFGSQPGHTLEGLNVNYSEKNVTEG